MELVFHLMRIGQYVLLFFLIDGHRKKESHKMPVSSQTFLSLISSGSENEWIDEWMNEQPNSETFYVLCPVLGELSPAPCMHLRWAPWHWAKCEAKVLILKYDCYATGNLLNLACNSYRLRKWDNHFCKVNTMPTTFINIFTYQFLLSSYDVS